MTDPLKISPRAEKIAQLEAELEQANDLIADMVFKCTEYGHDGDDWITSYIMPVGPIHRAIPWCQKYGITVRPGSRVDSRKERAAVLDENLVETYHCSGCGDKLPIGLMHINCFPKI
jgi:hypothetical protein